MAKQNNPTQNVLEQIEAKKLQVKAKWRFVLVRILRWISIAFLGTFAALNFSIAYFFLTAETMPIFRQPDIGSWKYALITLPTIWLAVFAILIIVAYKQFHATKCGYRYRFWAVIAVLCFLTLIPGITLSKMGIALKTHEFAQDHVPGYEKADMHDAFWNRPESGFLTGRIAEIESETLMEVHNRHERWTVDTSHAELIEAEELSPGDLIGIHGELNADQFIADKILLITMSRSKQ